MLNIVLILQYAPETYNIRKTAVIVHADCHLCGDKDVRVLCTDSSDGEYGTVQLCKPCIDKAWI
jgi:hypothetical protein